ncbi:hypothetical protein Ancab_023308 [Ancistrocladus abbreviatus]
MICFPPSLTSPLVFSFATPLLTPQSTSSFSFASPFLAARPLLCSPLLSSPSRRPLLVASSKNICSSRRAPVHQMQQYYRLGVLDNCSEKWNDLFDCLKLKTRRTSEVQEILETRKKAKPHIWSFRTPEEATANWKDMFGHLDKVE